MVENLALLLCCTVVIGCTVTVYILNIVTIGYHVACR